MAKVALAELLVRAQPFLDWYDQILARRGGQMLLKEFIEEVEIFSGHEIVWGPVSKLAPTTAGQTILEGGKYWLGYDVQLPSQLRDQTIIHELVHIYRGDVEQQGKLIVKREATSSLVPIQIKCEVDFNEEENEQLVEFIAGCIVEKLQLKPPKLLNGTMRGWFKRKES